MNSFEPDQNKPAVEENFDSRIWEVPEEESTIFSAPAAHKDKRKSAKGRAFRKIAPAALALVLVAAIIAGVVYFIPKTEQNEDSSGYVDDIRMMDASLFTEVDKVVLLADKNKIEFKKAEVKVDDSLKTQWTLAHVNPELTSVSYIENAVFSFMEQGYSKKVSEDKNDGKEYGFETPKYQVDFYKKGSEELYFSLIIGGYSPNDSGRYATTTLDQAVYFIRDTGFYQYSKIDLDFVEPEYIPAIEKESTYSDDNYTDGQLIYCDKLILSGTNFGKTYNIVRKKTDNITVFNNYHITSPVTRPANDDSVSNIVSLFSYGLESVGCYSYTTTAQDLKAVGLDNPDFSVTIKVGDIQASFSATLQDDGYYAVYFKGNKTIMKVDPAAFTPGAYKTKDLFNVLLFIENITGAANVTVESGGEAIKFDISTTFDETSNRDTISKVKVNGKELETLNFQNYYSHIISIKAQSYSEADIKGMKPSTTLTINHNNGTAPTVIQYYDIGTARYQVVVNGVKMGQISSSDHARIFKYAKNVAAGKTYNAR